MESKTEETKKTGNDAEQTSQKTGFYPQCWE